MAEQTVRVRGYREYVSSLNKVNKGAAKVVRAALREVAKPVAATAKSNLNQYPGISLGTIGPKVTTRGVAVTQRARKVTGLRPDFGSLQMTKGLIPALDEHADEVEAGADHALGILINSSGFH